MSYVKYSSSVSNDLLVVLLVILSSAVITSCVTVNSFIVVSGYTISQGTQIKAVYSETISVTLCSIICSIECGSAIYSPKNKTCITFVEKFYNSSIDWIKDPDWKVLYRNEAIQHGDWTMVFRAQKAIDQSMWDAWNATGRHDDSPLSRSVLNGCYRLDNIGGCKQHFRSSILDNWINIKQVKLSVYVNGSEVNYVVFNGTSSGRDTWFLQSNILTSSWSGIRNDLNIKHFELYGFSTHPPNKRFLVIYGAYPGCRLDSIYVSAYDQSWDGCGAENSIDHTHFPTLLYSMLNRLAVFGNNPKEYQLADVMAVFVQFK